MTTFLVLQHIACEPPAACEDELLAWGRHVVGLVPVAAAAVGSDEPAGA